jgi:diacylglycerol O-acyltransferase
VVAESEIGMRETRTGQNVDANLEATNDRLSWGDTVFLNLEREGMPLNVASVCVFDGSIPFKACVRFVESKLPLIPRYLKRVVPPPLNIGLPSWQFDPDFDILRHVRQVTLKHGSDAELKTLAGKIFGTVMDREHPLWDLTLVHGLNGNRTGLIFRLHHCLADGIAGVGIMNVLMDASPVAPRLPRRKLLVPAPPTPGILTSLTNNVVDTYSDFVKRILDGYVNVANIAERLAASAKKESTDEFGGLLPEIGASTQRLRFNVMNRGPQKFGWTDISLDEIKAIKSASGTHVNDVILALVTATIRRYVEGHGDPVKGRLFRMMVPVNLRGNDSAGGLGNCISLVPVTIPLDIRDPAKLLAEVHKRTEFLKRAHAAELVSLTGGVLSMIPAAAQALSGHVISRVPFTPFNMVCTNVPGPQTPLYLLGRKMLHCYPYVPIGGEMCLNCAILTYNGTAYFGFSGEVQAVPDLGRLERLLQLSFVELRKAAGIKARPTTRKEAVRKKKETKPAKAKAVAAPSAPASARAPAREAVRLPIPPPSLPLQSAAVALSRVTPASAMEGKEPLAHAIAS